MATDKQLSLDLKDVQLALEHALVYPVKSKLGDEEYNKAHAELQQALFKLKRIKRVIRGDRVGSQWNRTADL